MSMIKTEEFRKKAEEFETKAGMEHNPSVKRAYLELARHWRELAHDIEISKATSVGGED
jgi:hypothetical protein